VIVLHVQLVNSLAQFRLLLMPGLLVHPLLALFNLPLRGLQLLGLGQPGTCTYKERTGVQWSTCP
jgi:hypothetical protein